MSSSQLTNSMIFQDGHSQHHQPGQTFPAMLDSTSNNIWHLAFNCLYIYILDYIIGIGILYLTTLHCIVFCSYIYIYIFTLH